jgi:hypothetical protein
LRVRSSGYYISSFVPSLVLVSFSFLTLLSVESCTQNCCLIEKKKAFVTLIPHFRYRL